MKSKDSKSTGALERRSQKKKNQGRQRERERERETHLKKRNPQKNKRGAQNADFGP